LHGTAQARAARLPVVSAGALCRLALLAVSVALAACGTEGESAAKGAQWQDLAADACKVPGGGAPEVVIGEGRGAYSNLDEGQTMTVEAGPQGGHHVWLGVRTRQLRQSGSVLTVRGHLPDLATDVPPLSHVVTLHPAEAGCCEIFGVRFQVDREVALGALIGEVLEVEVEIEDDDGDVGIATRSVIIAMP
jgi:hypothetical protein